MKQLHFCVNLLYTDFKLVDIASVISPCHNKFDEMHL